MKTLRFYSLAIGCMALVLMLCGALRAAAQEVTATVTGTVTDSSGAAVVGAAVAVKSVERGVVYDATTNESGLYHISQLPVGSYEVRVEKAGFSCAIENSLAS